jgi:hypothetical protein
MQSAVCNWSIRYVTIDKECELKYYSKLTPQIEYLQFCNSYRFKLQWNITNSEFAIIWRTVFFYLDNYIEIKTKVLKNSWNRVISNEEPEFYLEGIEEDFHGAFGADPSDVF